MLARLKPFLEPVRPLVKRAQYYRSFGIARLQTPASKVAQYHIKAGYRHRLDNDYFDAPSGGDAWQREVYEAAAKEARETSAQVVYDIGCGSGRKLMQHFSHLRTVGFDVAETVRKLDQAFPDRTWRESSFADTVDEPADIVICADVVEHVPNPNQLMDFLARMKFSRLYLSTPERTLVYGFDQSGPPTNPAHCREWRMDEFRAYVEKWFQIDSHTISNRVQATQLVVCHQRP